MCAPDAFCWCTKALFVMGRDECGYVVVLPYLKTKDCSCCLLVGLLACLFACLLVFVCCIAVLHDVGCCSQSVLQRLQQVYMYEYICRHQHDRCRNDICFDENSKLPFHFPATTQHTRHLNFLSKTREYIRFLQSCGSFDSR